MPKLARYLLAWSKEDGCYELRERGENTSYALREDDARWSAWLEEHRSFAFQGKQGHLNLLKEARARGSDYWYAYRSQNRRTSKRYAGRTADITFSRLEELAGAFMREVEPQAPVPAEDPLLEPKLHAPRLQAALVARERLFARMQSGLERKLTLLCAPAGFGKTTLAGQWLNECRTHAQMPPVAWIALDSGDNDPIRFWRYVITACQRFHTGLGRALLAQLSDGLSISFELPSLETVLTPLLNEMARVGCSGMLILEDYHLITEARIQETLIFFLDHLPENMHVVMLTRSEPPFPLARWRARGELCEVLAADLRFSQEESASFFQQMQMSPAVTFSEEALRRLNERVEGWAAGLRLLALALQGSMRGQELEGALANFTGDQRSLQEYFVMEVLNAQSETLQDFLLRTSVISRLTGSLCDAVIERHGSARLLESVERAGLFLESLDGSGEWYRYHALFAEAMRVEARRRLGNDAMRLLYLRASQWYAQQEMLPEAIEAAFQAQDIERAAALIERLLEERANFIFGARIFQKMPEFHTLRRWLERLPEAILGAHPLLCLYYAASLMFICFLEQRVPSATITVQLGKMLQMAEESWRREGNRSRLGELLAFRAMILRQPGVMREAADYARQALELLPAEAIDGRMMSLWLLGMGEVEEGHFTLARKAFLEVRAFYEAVGSDGIMRANTVWLSWLDYVQGALPQAAEAFRCLLDEARAVEDIDDICDALLGLAQLAYEGNELSTAEHQAQEALELARQLNNHDLRVQATLILACVEHARGQVAAALRRCVSLLASLPAMLPPRARLVREIQLMLARLALTQGDFVALERWWADLTQPDEVPRLQRDREALLWVRWQLEQDRAESVLEPLGRLLEDAQEGERMGIVWEGQLLMALAYAALKRLPAARKQLQELFERVYAVGYVRLFLDEGEPLAALLQSILPAVRGEAQLAALRRLLLAFARQRATDSDSSPIDVPLVEPLSMQEQRVLQLLAVGRSNPEIARELVVSVNTVKAQVQSIYRKLNVTNRVEASEVARLLKLL